MPTHACMLACVQMQRAGAVLQQHTAAQARAAVQVLQGVEGMELLRHRLELEVRIFGRFCVRMCGLVAVQAVGGACACVTHTL